MTSQGVVVEGAESGQEENQETGGGGEGGEGEELLFFKPSY